MKPKRPGCLSWIFLTLSWYSLPFLLKDIEFKPYRYSPNNAGFYSALVYLSVPIIIGIFFFIKNRYAVQQDVIKQCHNFISLGYEDSLNKHGLYGKRICADFRKKQLMLIEAYKNPIIISVDQIHRFEWGTQDMTTVTGTKVESSNSNLTLYLSDPNNPQFKIVYFGPNASELVASKIMAMQKS